MNATVTVTMTDLDVSSAGLLADTDLDDVAGGFPVGAALKVGKFLLGVAIEVGAGVVGALAHKALHNE